MTNTGTLRRTVNTHFSIDWDIDDYFNTPHTADSYFESPNLMFGRAIWRLRLYPNGRRKTNTVGNVELFLFKEESFDDVHHISCTLGVEVDSNTIGSYEKFSASIDKCDQMHGGKITRRLDMERLRAHVLDTDETVTFFVKDLVIHNRPCFIVNADLKTQIQRMDKATLTDEGLQVQICRNVDLNTEKEGIEILSEKLKSLFLNEESCDVTFQVENTEIRAHKALLIAQSPVFASMFRHDMSETITGIVKIADCTPDAFKALILYMYSGTVENLSANIVYDLYEAAVKYDLEYLKNRCIKFMKNLMSSDTLCDTIALCLKYKESELLQHATDYFIENAIDILLTVKWQLFLKEDPTTANELYIKAMQKK